MYMPIATLGWSERCISARSPAKESRDPPPLAGIVLSPAPLKDSWTHHSVLSLSNSFSNWSETTQREGTCAHVCTRTHLHTHHSQMHCTGCFFRLFSQQFRPVVPGTNLHISVCEKHHSCCQHGRLGFRQLYGIHRAAFCLNKISPLCQF